MNLDEKLKFLREHREWKCPNKWELLNEHDSSWRENGLANLTFQKISDLPDEAFPGCRRILVNIAEPEAS